MMKSLFFLFTSFILILSSNAQNKINAGDEITIRLELNNPSPEINNATALIEIEGGVPPYQYKWSKKNTSLSSNRAEGLIEGMEHSVTVTDSNGNTASKTFEIPAKSITEIFNSNVEPAVDFLGAFLFWDPFASFGIYDPVVYISKDDIGLPHIKNTAQEYHLKKWLVPNETEVIKNQEIAILEIDGLETIVIADFDGNLQQIAEEGARISIRRKPTST